MKYIQPEMEIEIFDDVCTLLEVTSAEEDTDMTSRSLTVSEDGDVQLQ